MKKLVEWIADKILAGVADKDQKEFLDALKHRKEELTRFYHPSMWGMPEQYAFAKGETVVLNADEGDADIFYTLAKQTVNHLATSLVGNQNAT